MEIITPKRIVIALTLASVILSQVAEALVKEIPYTGGSKSFDKALIADSREYTCRVTGAPGETKYDWYDKPGTGIVSGGGDSNAQITWQSDVSKTSLTVKVKIYPPGEGPGQPYHASWNAVLKDPTLNVYVNTASGPGNAYIVEKTGGSQGIAADITGVGTLDIGGAINWSKEGTGIGSLSPTLSTFWQDTGGTPKVTTFSVSANGGTGTVQGKGTIKNELGDEIKDETSSEKIYVFKVDITTPSAGLTSLPIDQGLNVQATLTPSEAQGGDYTWSKASGTGNGAFSPNGTQNAVNSSFSATTAGKLEMKVEYEINQVTADSSTKKVDILPIPYVDVNFFQLDYFDNYEIRLWSARAYCEFPQKPDYYNDYYDYWHAPSHPEDTDSYDIKKSWGDGSPDYEAYIHASPFVATHHPYSGPGSYDTLTTVWSNCERKLSGQVVQGKDCSDSDFKRITPQP